MPYTLNPACPLCGLRFENQPILDLHMREDHRRLSFRERSGDGDPRISGSPTTRPDNTADPHDPATAPSRTPNKATAEPAGRGRRTRGRRTRRARTALRRVFRMRADSA